MKLDHLLTPYAKLKAYVRPETTQLEENSQFPNSP